MNNNISEEKFPILIICRCEQMFKNVFVIGFQNFEFVFDKGEIKEYHHEKSQ